MLSRDPNYTRLKAGGASLSGRSSYWLGTDHLLLVEVRGTVEGYRRFALKDIAGIAIRATRVYIVALAAASVLLLALMATLAATLVPSNFAGDGAAAVQAVFGTLSALVLLFLVMHLVRGPTCYCELFTGVQTVRLPGIHRRRQAERFLARLAPAVRAAQGIG